MSRLILPLALAAALSAGPPAHGGDYHPYVFRIEVKRPGEKVKVELTAFKVAGENGLYTALHGVAGAEAVAAVLPAGKDTVRIEGLELTQADVARDVAFLELKKGGKELPAGGLNVGRRRDLAKLAGQEVTVIGFPIGIDLLAARTALVVRTPAAAPLTELLNAEARDALRQRASPDVARPMLNLQGNLLPGHSGAPILDREGIVVGIGSGGLNRGAGGHGWAVPFLDVTLTDLAKDPDRARQVAALGRQAADSSAFCVIDDAARKRAERLPVVARTFVEGADGKLVMALPKPPREAVRELLDRTKGELEKGANADPPKFAFDTLIKSKVLIASGTAVEVLEVEDRSEKAEGPVRPLLPALGDPEKGAMKDRPFLKKLQERAEKGGPAGQFPLLDKLKESNLGALADAVNVKVRVLEGVHKGAEVWVPRDRVKRETVAGKER